MQLIGKNAAETATYVRDQLKACFPGTKFSVRKTDWSSLSIRWTDGPTCSRVDAVVQQYTRSKWDSSDESTRRLEPTLVGMPDGTTELVEWGLDHIETHRRISERYQAQLEVEAARIVYEKLGRDWCRTDWYPEFDTGHGVCYAGEGHHVAWYLSLHIAPQVNA